MNSEKEKYSVVKYINGLEHHVKSVNNKWITKNLYNFVVALPNLKGKEYMEKLKSDAIPRHCWPKYACKILKSDFDTLEGAEQFESENDSDFLETVSREITDIKKICNQILGKGEEKQNQAQTANESMDTILKKIHSVKDICHQILKNQQRNEVAAGLEDNEAAGIVFNETAGIGRKAAVNVGDNEAVNVGDNEAVNVGGNEVVNVGGNEVVNVGGNEVVNVGGNEDVNVGGNEADNVGGIEVVNVGGIEAVNVGGIEAVNVGGNTLLVLPVNEDGDLRTFNEHLNDAMLLEMHIRDLEVVRAKNAKEMLRVISSRVVSDKLLSEYSYFGQRKKKEFQPFGNVTNLIVSSAVRGSVSQLKGKTDEEIKQVSGQLHDELQKYFQEKCFKYAAARRSAL